MTQKQESRLAIFERKVLRSIFGGLEVDGVWRRRYNFELYKIFRDSDISKYVKLQRMRWAGHVVRMPAERTPLKVLNAKPLGQRPRGRPKIRWIDCVDASFRAIGSANWRSTAKTRHRWKKLIEKARIQSGL